MMMKWKSVILATTTMILLTGCGNSETKSSKEENSSKEKIIVYSNSVSDGRGDFLKEKSKENGFDIEIVDIGGGELLNRVIAEKEAPIADVVFGMNQMMFSKIEDEDILEPYKPIWLDKVDPSLINKNNMFSPLQEQRVFMIYDSDKLKEDDIVEDWQQLSRDEKGNYIVPSGLGGATANAIVYNILMNYQDDSGKMGISEEGWKEVENYFKNGLIASEGQTEIAELANGSVSYSYTWLSNVPIVEESLGVNIGVVSPPYGVPQTVEQVGIIKKDNLKSDVKDFVDFLGSSEIQSEWAEKFGSAPVNEDAKSSINSRIIDILESTTPQNNDYIFINQHLDEWVEYIELNILGN